MNRLELKVPPPVVALCLALLMWFAPSPGQPEAPLQVRIGAALVLVLIGQSISIAGMVAFRRARTTINPIKASDASSLVTTGVYRFTRNPMRSEEHTSELQSPCNLVCRLLLEKKKP